MAENVRSRRVAAGLSQKALAEAAGISLRMVDGIERGATSVSTATLDRIGMALNATLSELVAAPEAAPGAQVERLGWSGPQGGSGVLRSSVAARREVELWDWELMPGERYRAAADPQGWHVMIGGLDGVLALELGATFLPLSAAGQAFDRSQAHAFFNAG